MFRKAFLSFKVLVFFLCSTFLMSFLLFDLIKVKSSHAVARQLGLPAPTQLIDIDDVYSLPVLKGINVDKENPFNIDFIFDANDRQAISEKESDKLIRYFLSGLTVGSEDMWVNLSPYENDRVLPDSLSATNLGNEMIKQDYILKQLSASITYPKSELGEKYWAAVDEISQTNAFCKIWIVPGNIEIFNKESLAVITDAKLKVLHENDYLAMVKNSTKALNRNATDILIPTIEKDVNDGKNFAQLRQVYHSLVLANWFKDQYKDTVLAYFFNTKKMTGLQGADSSVKDKVFDLYVEAFTKGAYDLSLKEETESKDIKRNYFSGGQNLAMQANDFKIHNDFDKINFHRPSSQKVSCSALISGGLESFINLSKKSIAKVLRPMTLITGMSLFLLACASEDLQSVSPRVHLDSLHNVRDSVFDTDYDLTTADSALELEQAVQGIISLIDNRTGLPVSHLGTSVLSDWAFTYDVACHAEALRLAGRRAEAQRMLDFYARKLRIPQQTVRANADANGFNGALVTFKSPFNNQWVTGLATAVSTQDNSLVGSAREWRSGAGPTAFLMKAMMKHDYERYSDVIEKLAEFLLAIQNPKGGFSTGVFDGKFEKFVATEPHLDAMMVLSDLYVRTGNLKYRNAAENAYSYALKTTVKLNKSEIYQGAFANGITNPIHATDVYTWGGVMLSPYISLKAQRNLIERFEEKSLVNLSFERIDGQRVDVVSVDFTNPSSMPIKALRRGYHPMGSPEWMLGAVTMYQNAAVRFYKAGDTTYAIELKAKAEALLANAIKMSVLQNNARYWTYSTAQARKVGHGWETPVWDSKAGLAAQGYRSSIANPWYIFTSMAYNVFDIGDGNMYETYGKIPSETSSRADAILRAAVKNPHYVERSSNIFRGSNSNLANFDQDYKQDAANLLLSGVPDENVDWQWKAKAVWWDYANTVELNSGDTLEITLTLNGASRLGVQLKGQHEGDNDKGDMKIFDVNDGQEITLEFVVPSSRDMRRLVFQIGENAWGNLGGSMDATISVKNVKIKESSSALGGIDFGFANSEIYIHPKYLGSTEIFTELEGVRVDASELNVIDNITQYLESML